MNRETTERALIDENSDTFPKISASSRIRKIKLSNTSYKNYEVIVDAACEAWNMFVEEEGNVKKLCSRDWATIER